MAGFERNGAAQSRKPFGRGQTTEVVSRSRPLQTDGPLPAPARRPSTAPGWLVSQVGGAMNAARVAARTRTGGSGPSSAPNLQHVHHVGRISRDPGAQLRLPPQLRCWPPHLALLAASIWRCLAAIILGVVAASSWRCWSPRPAVFWGQIRLPHGGGNPCRVNHALRRSLILAVCQRPSWTVASCSAGNSTRSRLLRPAARRISRKGNGGTMRTGAKDSGMERPASLRHRHWHGGGAPAAVTCRSRRHCGPIATAARHPPSAACTLPEICGG